MAFLDETGLAEVWSLINQKFGNIAVGSYTGARAAGSGSPVTLSFDFDPKLVIVADKSTNGNTTVTLPCIFVAGQTIAVYQYNDNRYQQTLTWGNKSLSWYCAAGTSPSHGYMQLNDSSNYQYIALG